MSAWLRYGLAGDGPGVLGHLKPSTGLEGQSVAKAGGRGMLKGF